MTAFSNANSNLLAASIASGKVGTFSSVEITKQGVVRGGKSNPVRYGDDKVLATLFTGFKYVGLCKRSLDILSGLSAGSIVADMGGKVTGFVRVWKKSAKVGDLRAVCTDLGLDATGGKADLVARLDAAVPGGMKEVVVTEADVEEAVADLKASLQSSIDGTNESTTDDVFEPLVVNGSTVRGARVYVGPNGDGEMTAPKGTIYIQGLKVASKVIEPAANGPIPASKSAPKSAAKRWIRARLPIGKYVSYRLEPGTEFTLKVGGAAVVHATENGIVLNESIKAAVKAA